MRMMVIQIVIGVEADEVTEQELEVLSSKLEKLNLGDMFHDVTVNKVRQVSDKLYVEVNE